MEQVVWDLALFIEKKIDKFLFQNSNVLITHVKIKIDLLNLIF